MKQGLSLTQLAHEIERQQASKRDIVASTKHMRVEPDDNGLHMKVVDGKTPMIYVKLNRICQRQIAQHTGIPAAYYDRMANEQPALLAHNVNTWLHDAPTPRLLRMMDGNGRAFLSNNYRPLENADLAEAVLPHLLEMNVMILSCQITESRLYIKAIDNRIKYDMPQGAVMGKGHTVFRTMSPAITISNSEVGMGALTVDASVYDSFCTNLANLGSSIRKAHLGGKNSVEDDVYELLTSKTRRLTDAALWAQIGDVVKASFDEAKFTARVREKIEPMQDDKIEGDTVKTVEFTAKKFGLNETERTSVLTHLIQGGDLSRFGLYNAVTRTAEDVEDYDRATEFEKLGGKIVDLPRNEWKQIAEAA